MKTGERLSFVQFAQLCEQNSLVQYVDECSHCMENEDCLFDSFPAMPYEHVLSLYKLRLSIAENSGNQHEPNYLPDFRRTIENIESIQSAFIGIVYLAGEKFSYVVFYAPLMQKVLGILKVKSKSSLTDKENHNTEIIDRGMSTLSEKYSKGKFIRNWQKED